MVYLIQQERKKMLCSCIFEPSEVDITTSDLESMSLAEQASREELVTPGNFEERCDDQ